MSGGTDTEWSIAGNAGSIDLSGGDGSTSEETANENGGNGGSLLLSGESLTGADGGTIDCRGLNGNPGGSINTSEGGGSINTRGTGSIELGGDSTRTILVGSANGGNKTITLPNITGKLPIALISSIQTIPSSSNFATNSYTDFTFTVTGALINDPLFVTCLEARTGSSAAKLIFVGFVSASNTVTVRVHNPGAGAISNGSAMTLRIVILKTA